MTEVIETNLSPNDEIVRQELMKHKASVTEKAPESAPQVKVEPEPELKPKSYTVQLSVEQEARLIREASNRQLTAKKFLQEQVNEMLNVNIGRAFVSSATFMGSSKKIVAPSNRGI